MTQKAKKGRPNTLNTTAKRGQQEKFMALCPDGKKHPVRKIGNIYQVMKKGKMVSGTVSGGEFVPTGKNAGVFSPDYRTGKGWMVGKPEFVTSLEDRPEPVGAVELRTLWDIANAEGELDITPGDIDVIAKVMHILADAAGKSLNAHHVKANLKNLPRSGWSSPELSMVTVLPALSINLSMDFPTEVANLIDLLGAKPKTKSAAKPLSSNAVKYL